MSVWDLKVGDRIRITSIPKIREWHPETVAVYKRLIARGRSVRIQEVPENGFPVFECRFREPDGSWVYQYWTVRDDDDNWVPVKPRKKHG